MRISVLLGRQFLISCEYPVLIKSKFRGLHGALTARLLKYLARSPIALESLHYVEATGQVTYRTKKGVPVTSN